MDINKIKRRLLIKYPLFGSVMAKSSFVIEPSVGTAATDGSKIYYSPKFMESLTEDEQVFVLAHEVCHIALNHIFRSEGKDNKLWNIATDSVINAYLKQDGLSAVEGAVDIPDAINFDSETMYQKLLEEKENEQNSLNSKENNNTQSKHDSSNSMQDNLENEDENYDIGHDTHSMWGKAIEDKHQKEQSESNEISEQENSNEKTELSEKEVFKQNKVERDKQLEELRESLANKSILHGSDTNGETRRITNIGASKPLIDWRILLREAINYDVDWTYQNAEIEYGVLKPRLEEIPISETEILLDTSGSIDENLLRNFLRECKNIMQTSKVKVGCFDTKFYGFNEIRKIADIDNLEFKGGGGTNFEVAVNAFTRRVENKIIFTDGYASMPNTPVDAIWIVFGDKEIKPKGGRVIHISERELARLSSFINTEKEIKGRRR